MTTGDIPSLENAARACNDISLITRKELEKLATNLGDKIRKETAADIGYTSAVTVICHMLKEVGTLAFNWLADG